MAQFIKNYVQDLAQDIQIRHCGTLIFNTDSDSNVIHVSLYNGQEEAPQSGSVACAVICSDGSTVPVTGGTISGNTVSVTLGADGLIPGQVGIGIQVISGDVKTTVFKAIYNVELFETDNVVDPSSRITISVGELVSDIETAVASIPADYSDLLAAIAPTFSASTAYASGSYVWYSGHLYRFTAAHSAGAWVGTDASQAALANDVSDLKSAISDVNDELYTTEVKTLYYDDITWERGFLNKNGGIGESTSYMVSAYLPVSEGDSVIYDGLRSPTASYLIIAAYDSSKTAVNSARIYGTGSAESGTYSVPSGISYIRVSTYDYNGDIYFQSITMPVEVNRLDGLDDEIDAIEDRVDAVEDAVAEALPLYQYTLGFDDFEYTTGKVASKDGEQTRSDGQVTNYISTENMLSVSASNVHMVVYSSSQYAAVIACYDSNKNLLTSKSLFASGTFGRFVDVTGTVTITSDIAYIRLSRLKYSADTSIFVVTKNRTLAEDYDITKEEVSDIENELNPWKGKKWYAFGTSLTDNSYLDPNNDPTGKYPQILNQWMQANLVNKGRGGGGITSHSNGAILTEIQNTDFSDADLVTLEGFPNDYSAAPGTFTDTTTDTLCGALYVALSAIYATAPNATVVLITASQGQLNQQGTAGYPINFVSATGNYQVEYNEAIIKMGQYFGCHVIDTGGKAQINNYHPEYLVDHIHHSWAGGWQFAATIWEEMKNIHPNTNNPYLEEGEGN